MRGNAAEVMREMDHQESMTMKAKIAAFWTAFRQPHITLPKAAFYEAQA
jgi:hypothetical protein